MYLIKLMLIYTNTRIIVIGYIASWVSFYFRTSTFENVLYHWSVSYVYRDTMGN